MTLMGLSPEEQRKFYEPPKPRRYIGPVTAFILGLLLSAFANELWRAF